MTPSPTIRRHFIDGEAFTRLFRHRRRNHARILETLFILAREMSRKYRHRNRDVLEDAVSDALLLAICNLKKFKLNNDRADAFRYFSKMMGREVYRRLKAEKERDRRVFPESSLLIPLEQYRHNPLTRRQQMGMWKMNGGVPEALNGK